jgi:peptide/nickel transport system permease protein
VAAPELTVLEQLEETKPSSYQLSPGTMIALGIACVVAGLVVLWISLVPMGSVDGIIKVPVFLASTVLMFVGVDRIGKGLFGPWFDTGFWLCFAWLIGLSFAAILAGWLPLAEYQDTKKTLAIPGNARPDLFSKHPLGTNNFSLDLLARCIYGARVSLLTVAVAVSISMTVGGTIGLFAGYYRHKLDMGVGVLTDAILSIPPLILLVALAAVLGQPTDVGEAVLKNGMALAVVGIPTMARLARANTLVFAQREFVQASRALGAKNTRIIFRDLLPNVVLPVVSYAFIIVATLIVAEGSLAFLGLGLQEPKPTWGNMIAEGNLNVLRAHPHIPLVPGVFMFLTVLSFNRVGERARNLWDPREAKI